MKLKKLELFGFKSFADKEDFVFEPGVTVIVGPNGCGKSNVIDAIKWILGEQSAKSLRGREMSDVIFGGSEARPAMGFAEASITFSNDDHLLPIEYNEVTVSRRLYTSGESEYLLNKGICRLKDVRELFLGTGIGVNSYSIIEQGRVEALLQANAHERRAVFEEAAGISKYKTRKKEAMAKLEKTQQNLLRIDDVVREVERQLRSTKIQAARARKHEEHCARLRELKIGLTLKNFGDLGKLKGDTAAEVDRCSRNIEDELAVIDSEEVEILDMESQLNGIDQKMSEANAVVMSVDAQITNSRDRVEFCKEKLKDVKRQESDYDREVSVFNEKIEKNEVALLEAKRSLEVVEQGITGDTEYLRAEETKSGQITLEIDMLTERLDERRGMIMDIFHKQSKIQNEIGNQSTITETLKIRKGRVLTVQSELCRQIELTGQNIQTLEDKRASLLAEASGLGEEVSALNGSADILNGEIATCDNDMRQLENVRSSKQSRLEVLEDYEARSEGIDDGAKTILNEVANGGESITGVHGLVADIIDVELEYALAIETALGGMARSIVIGGYDESLNAINYLKEHDAGHATFLLIDMIDCWAGAAGRELPDAEGVAGNRSSAQSGFIDGKFGGGAGIVGRASDIVRYDERFASVIDYLLGSILVVQDFDKASFLMRGSSLDSGGSDLAGCGCGDIKRLVTLDGAVIDNTGFIKGGVVREKSGLILRKSEIQSIRGEILENDRQIAKLSETRMVKSNELGEIRESLDSLTQRSADTNIALLNNDSEMKGARQRADTLGEEYEINGSELREIEAEVGSIAGRNVELREKLGTINEQQRGLETEVNAISGEISDKDGERADIQEEITNLKITIAQRKEKIESVTDGLKQCELNDIEFKNHVNAKLFDIEECKTKRQSIVEESERLECALHEFGEKRTMTEDMLKTLVVDRNSVFDTLSCKKAELSKHKTMYSDLEEQMQELRLKENEYRVRMSDLEERIFEEYNIRLAELSEAHSNRADGYGSVRGDESGTANEPNNGDGGGGVISCLQQGAASVRDREAGGGEMDDASNGLETDWESVKIEIGELKGKIERMGSVNLESIKELDELEERYQFLTGQRADLAKSEASLNDIVEKLNGISRELFEKTFNDVKENFHVYFRKLFGGGRANILLEEGVDVLDAGVDIVIQPPSKEFRSIALFSGGEKVLITVALLLAIFKSKPAPFCLMDEVDAALDENNIGRFTTVLKEFAADSQFVIVSHNKKTMNIADVIYGVTMEEPGVSKKVAVKFDRFTGDR